MLVDKAAFVAIIASAFVNISVLCEPSKDKKEETHHGDEKPRWEKLIYQRPTPQKQNNNLHEKLISDHAHLHHEPKSTHGKHPLNWERAQRLRHLAALQERYHGKLNLPFGQVEKPRPRFFLEVVTIRERVVVDEHNKPKSFLATIQNSLFASTNGAGKLRKIFQSTMTIRPKKQLPHNIGHKDPAALSAAAHNYHLHQGVEEEDWFDRIIEKFHLDQFWPRLAASILLGFISTLIIFGIAKLIQYLFFNPATDGYNGVPGGSDEGDELIKSERKRAETVKAVSAV